LLLWLQPSMEWQELLQFEPIDARQAMLAVAHLQHCLLDTCGESDTWQTVVTWQTGCRVMRARELLSMQCWGIQGWLLGASLLAHERLVKFVVISG
jgi:hypothetical protein